MMEEEQSGRAVNDGLPATGETPIAGAWTPGPWKHSAITAPPIERDERVWVYAPDGNGNHPRIAVVEAVMRDGDRIAINTANARLIAAAPEMYEALKLAAEAFRGYERLHLEKGTVEGAQKAAANAHRAARCEAALSKASQS